MKTLRWTPDETATGFWIAITFDRPLEEPRLYVVAVDVLDGAGEKIDPSNERWGYSEKIGSRFQYVSMSKASSVVHLSDWTSDLYYSEVLIRVFPWNARSSENPPVPLSCALAAVSESSSSNSRIWAVYSLVGPTTPLSNNQEVAE